MAGVLTFRLGQTQHLLHFHLGTHPKTKDKLLSRSTTSGDQAGGLAMKALHDVIKTCAGFSGSNPADDGSLLILSHIL
jgi:hypothetical protein